MSQSVAVEEPVFTSAHCGASVVVLALSARQLRSRAAGDLVTAQIVSVVPTDQSDE
jgi:hypothetical protein